MVNLEAKEHAHTKDLMKQKSNEHNLLLVIINSFLIKKMTKSVEYGEQRCLRLLNFLLCNLLLNKPSDLNRIMEIRNIASNVYYCSFHFFYLKTIKTKYERKHKRLTKNLKNVISFTLHK